MGLCRLLILGGLTEQVAELCTSIFNGGELCRIESPNVHALGVSVSICSSFLSLCAADSPPLQNHWRIITNISCSNILPTEPASPAAYLRVSLTTCGPKTRDKDVDGPARDILVLESIDMLNWNKEVRI